MESYEGLAYFPVKSPLSPRHSDDTVWGTWLKVSVAEPLVHQLSIDGENAEVVFEALKRKLKKSSLTAHRFLYGLRTDDVQGEPRELVEKFLNDFQHKGKPVTEGPLLSELGQVASARELQGLVEYAHRLDLSLEFSYRPKALASNSRAVMNFETHIHEGLIWSVHSWGFRTKTEKGVRSYLWENLREAWLDAEGRSRSLSFPHCARLVIHLAPGAPGSLHLELIPSQYTLILKEIEGASA